VPTHECIPYAAETDVVWVHTFDPGLEAMRFGYITKGWLRLTICSRAAATICPRPGLQVVTQYTSCTHMDRSPLLYVHVGLPVQPTKSAWWPFDLLTSKVVSESRVTWATSAPILVFLCLSVLELGPMNATDTDRRQTKVSLNAPAY